MIIRRRKNVNNCFNTCIVVDLSVTILSITFTIYYLDVFILNILYDGYWQNNLAGFGIRLVLRNPPVCMA